MAVYGHQHFWIAGARVYFQKDAAAGANPEPLLDLGLVREATPAIEPVILELKDSATGLKKVVDRETSDITETHNVTLVNMNLQNLSFLFLSDDPEIINQVQLGIPNITHYMHNGHFVKLLDALGSAVFGLFSIDAVYGNTGAVSAHGLESINATAHTLTLLAANGDQTAKYSAGTKFAITGNLLTNPKNAGTYKVLSSSFSTKTTVTLDQTFRKFVAAEPALSTGTPGATLVANTPGSPLFYTPEVDWEVASLDRGALRVIPSAAGGTISTGNYRVAYTPANLAGSRILRPQAAKGTIRGTMYLFLSMDNFSHHYVREAKVAITPAGATIPGGDYSTMTLSVQVLNDLASTFPAGKIIHMKGQLPLLSSVQESALV